MNKIMKQPFIKMFMKRRKNKGKNTIWASVIGLGLSAAVFGITKGKRKEGGLPLQNMMKNMTPRKSNINLMDNAALTEFSEELLTSALNKDKNMPQKNQ